MNDTFEYHGQSYPRLNARFLWTLGHWDGPMTGIATYQDKPYYAKCHQSILANPPRAYWLYPITDEEFSKEEAYQNLFRKYYGYHCDYDKDGKRLNSQGYSEAATKSWSKWFCNIIWTIKTAITIDNKPSYDTMRKQVGLSAFHTEEEEKYMSRKPIGFFFQAYTKCLILQSAN